MLSVEFVMRWKGKIRCYLLNGILWLNMHVIERMQRTYGLYNWGTKKGKKNLRIFLNYFLQITFT
jgi:hypothetical protein